MTIFPSKPRLCIVEDDQEQRETLHTWLKLNDYPIWSTESAESFYKTATVNPVDIVIIDLGLPGEDGFSAIRHLRKHSTIGIIVVSARSLATDRVDALQSGADIYLIKPVVPEELLTCIENLWRRIQPPALDSQMSLGLTATAQQGLQTMNDVWHLGCAERYLVSPNGISVKLTPSEIAIMDAFSKANGPLSRHDIILALGANPKSFQMNRIDVHLSRLRNKILNACQMTIPITLLPGSRLQFLGKIERK